MSIKKAIKRFVKFAVNLYQNCQLCGAGDPYIDDDNPLCYRCATPENLAKIKNTGSVKNRFSSLKEAIESYDVLPLVIDNFFACPITNPGSRKFAYADDDLYLGYRYLYMKSPNSAHTKANIFPQLHERCSFTIPMKKIYEIYDEYEKYMDKNVPPGSGNSFIKDIIRAEQFFPYFKDQCLYVIIKKMNRNVAHIIVKTKKDDNTIYTIKVDNDQLDDNQFLMSEGIAEPFIKQTDLLSRLKNIISSGGSEVLKL